MSTSAAIERMRARMLPLIEAAAAEVAAEHDQLERDAAAAIEHATSTRAIAAAYEQGRRDREREIIGLLTTREQTSGRIGIRSWLDRITGRHQ